MLRQDRCKFCNFAKVESTSVDMKTLRSIGNICKHESCYDFVNVDGLQLVIKFDAKSKMLLKPFVGATFMRNELE